MQGLRMSVSATFVVVALYPYHVHAAAPIGTAFTYQGQLKMDGQPLSGSVDLEFTLWDSETTGAALGVDLHEGVDVVNGLFDVELDFGTAVVTSVDCWLGVAVAYPSGAATVLPLTPRQHVTPTPLALALPGFCPQPNNTSPNLVGGWSGNFVADGVVGGTISGGGNAGTDALDPQHNAVTDDYGTVGGGAHNRVGNRDANLSNARAGTVSGGRYNNAFATASTVSGGAGNEALAPYATVAGGWSNRAEGLHSVVSGGNSSIASADFAVVSGGWRSEASGVGAVVGGGGMYDIGDGSWTGMWNSASGTCATVPGGLGNVASGDLSLAAGHGAEAAHAGSFVWGDATDAPDVMNKFASTGPNQFLIRASGGVGIGTNAPKGMLHVAGDYYGRGHLYLYAYEGDGRNGTAYVQARDKSGSSSIGLALRTQSGGTFVDAMLLSAAGNVGVGTSQLNSKFNVNGIVESLAGGFKFPDGTVQTTAAGSTNGLWRLGGNSGTSAASDFLGTTDAMSLSIRVNNRRALQIMPNNNGPSIVGGYAQNAVGVGVVGGTVGGGGGKTNSAPQFRSNTVNDSFGTVSGGWDNHAGNGTGSVSDASGATVSGGWSNNASGLYASIGGGHSNTASGTGARVPGGADNAAEGRYSLAAGRTATAIHDGTFVWADDEGPRFSSTGPAQFLIRAAGGVGIGTNAPGVFQLAVNGNAAKPGGGSWAVYSDARLKKNVEPLRGALHRLLRLSGVTFEYKNPGEHFAMPGRQTGLIAQEVETVFPEWVEEDADGYKYVTVRGMEALLVEALRELNDGRVADMRAMRKETDALRKRLDRIETALRDVAAVREPTLAGCRN